MDLLDLLAETEPRTHVVHAVRPNMWAACGWCVCGCEGRLGDTYVLRERSTAGVTCQDCITEMNHHPWGAAPATKPEEVTP